MYILNFLTVCKIGKHGGIHSKYQMSAHQLYPLTGTIILTGTAAFLYGIATSSPLCSIEGLVLLWLGCYITLGALEAYRTIS
jgi:hypothetical protein